MSKSRQIAGVLAVLMIVSLLLSACNTPTAEPTPDAQAIFTAAAQTVQAQLSQTAAAMPTNTTAPTSTNTPPPPTATIPVGTLIPALPGAGAQPGAALPTQPLAAFATATVARGPVADKAEWQYQTPEDNTIVDPDSKFDIIWTLKNTGTTTWTKDYTYRFYVGDKLYESKTTYNLRADVPPGSNVDLIVDGKAPSKAGTYKMAWVITNKDGANFYAYDITLKVGSSASATEVAGATATPSSPSWWCIDKDRSRPFNNECKTYCEANPDVDPCYVGGVLYVAP